MWSLSYPALLWLCACNCGTRSYAVVWSLSYPALLWLRACNCGTNDCPSLLFRRAEAEVPLPPAATASSTTSSYTKTFGTHLRVYRVRCAVCWLCTCVQHPAGWSSSWLYVAAHRCCVLGLETRRVRFAEVMHRNKGTTSVCPALVSVTRRTRLISVFSPSHVRRVLQCLDATQWPGQRALCTIIMS